MSTSPPNTNKALTTETPAVKPEPEKKQTKEREEQTPALNSIFQVFELVAEGMLIKLREPPPQVSSRRQKWNAFVQLAKDIGPLVTGVASILVGIVAVIVTASVGFFNYQFNVNQAEATQRNLKTTALADFIEQDDGKRKLAALKLAAYGAEALPAVKLALGAPHDDIRSGGAQTGVALYQSRPDLRQALLAEMLNWFKESNPTLRLGVLEFYSGAALQLTAEERAAFFAELKLRLGQNANSCANETGAFVQQSVTFLAVGSFHETKELLLGIAQNCPHAAPEYAGARNHAVNVLPIVVQQQRLPKNERDAVVSSLRNLKADASDELNSNIDTAIQKIEETRDP